MSAIGFYFFYIINWIITLLPLPVLYIFSDFFFFVIFHLSGYRKEVVINNLKNAYPNKSDEDLHEIRKKFTRHLCDLFVEVLKLSHISAKQLNKRVNYKNPELLKELEAKNKSILCICAHYGNWEWLITIGDLSVHQPIGIFKPLSNKHFGKFLNSLRSQFGLEPVSMKQTLKSLVNYHNQGILTNSLFAVDQSPPRTEIQYWRQFLNQDTALYLGPEKIARKLDFAVVFSAMRKIKRGYYEVEFMLITDSAKNTALHEITDKHVEMLENLINETPHNWLWSHKRWKHVPES